MISEQLLGEAIGIIGDGQRSKHSINGVLLGNMTSINNSNTTSSPSISPALSPSPSSSTVTTPTSSSAAPGSENLRCPRCDSTNTKFCYYNNYNLTQPRHFCKTCRRYWTKGGALRNVPIGGGCRKNKSSTVITSSSAAQKSTAAGKFRAMAAEIGKSGFMSNLDGGHDSPILWSPPPPDQNSHLLSLLKANQNPNPSPNSGPMSSFVVVKEEVSPAAQVISSLWRDNINERQHIGLGAHDLYQRLRSSANNYSLPSGNINVGSSSSSLTILDSAPVAAADQLGCWNPILSWSDLPATHGAYPSIN